MSRTAFALMEVVVASAVGALLTVGIGAAVVAASRTMPDRTTTGNVGDGPEGARRAAAVVESIAAELATATDVTTFTSPQITFNTSDQNGDSTAETITYSWSGVPGAPVQRLVAGGPTVTLLPSVQDFALSAIITSSTRPASDAVLAGSEIPLFQALILGGSGSKDVSNTQSLGQRFKPTLPDSATGWSLTRVLVLLKQNGSIDGQLRIQVLALDASGMPTGPVLSTIAVDESSLPSSYATMDYTFPSPVSFTPAQGACLILRHSSGSKSASASTIDHFTQAGAAMLTSSDGCLTWTATSDRAIAMDIYGKVSVSSGASTTTSFYERIGIRLRPGKPAKTAIEGGVRLLNRPVVPE